MEYYSNELINSTYDELENKTEELENILNKPAILAKDTTDGNRLIYESETIRNIILVLPEEINQELINVIEDHKDAIIEDMEDEIKYLTKKY